MGKRQTRKQYTKEFKLDVIGRSYQCENIRELAIELGISPLAGSSLQLGPALP